MSRRTMNLFPVQSMLLGLASFALAATVSAQPPTATKEHEVFKMDVGVWDAQMKIWPVGPDGEVLTAKCVETNRMLGDLWLVSDFEGEIAGGKFVGHGQFGYDPLKKSYVGTWVDNMLPTMSVVHGKYNAETKTMTMEGKMFDPELGKEIGSKSVAVYVDKDTRRMEMFKKVGDQWVKSMEVAYKRSK